MMNGVEKSEDFLEVDEGNNNKIMAQENQVDQYGLFLNIMANTYAYNTRKLTKRELYDSY